MHSGPSKLPHPTGIEFEKLLENLPGGVYTCDAEGLVTYFNSRAVEVWGREPRLGDPVDRFCGSFRLFAADGSPIRHDQCWMALALKTGREYNEQEIIVERPDGTRIVALAHANPVCDASGQIVGAVNVLVDITERKRAEEAHALLAAIVRCSDDAIVSKTLEGRILSWNDGAERLFGHTAAEAIGQPITLIIPPERHDEEEALLARLRRGEHIDHYETVRVTRQGRRVNVSLSISPVRDAAGRIVAASKVARDITERKQADETIRSLLRISERLNSTLDAEALLDILVQEAIGLAGAESGFAGLLSPSGMVSRRYFRDGASVPLDYCWPAMHGLPGWLIVHRAPYVANDAARDPHMAQEPYRSLEVRSAISVPILTAQRELLGFFELHNKKEGERFSDADRDRLVAVSQAAAIAVQNALAYRRVRETEDELKESQRRKDEFLATLAHELRNPLAPIKNALHFMKLKGAPDPELQTARDIIERQANQLSRLVDDLLDLSRITRGLIQLRTERVPLGMVLSHSVEASRPLVDAAGHELTVSLPAEPLWAEVDVLRLAQVFSNLLNNAAKYTERGGKISLAAERQGSDAIVSVTDTGIGIPPEMLSTIFDMFTQLDHSLERTQGGLGIGLTLAKRLVEMHGGTIEAHSEGTGRGSRFVVRLPLVVSSPATASFPRSPISLRASQPRRILVVDDHADAADTLAMMLRAEGHEVYTAHDGVAGVEAAERHRPEFIVLDIGLPGLNGYEAARRIRAQTWGADVCLIALTGWGQEGDKRRASLAGFDHHLTKPADISALQRLLASKSRRSGAGAVAAR